MADSSTPMSADPSLLQSLKLHLEGLKRTQHGQILYNQIQRGLQQYGSEDGRIEFVFVTFLHALLGKYAMSPACDPATRVKARLIQQRLTLYLPKAPPAPKPAVTPPRTATPVEAKPVIAPPAKPKPSAPPVPVVVAKPEPAPVIKPEPVVETATPPMVASKPTPVEAEPVPPAEPMPPSRQEKIEALEDTLAGQVTESIAVDEKFGELLEKERETLKNLDSPLGEFADLKQILVKGLNELIEERESLIDKLSSAGDYLKAVETDRERLRQELGHARKHSMADELTGLPKRDVFVKQLEAEIGRVKRYGFALAVAVIDVDNLESVNKRYGRDAGDAVLRCYASQILAKFRTYDLVARYGDDEFAVLFPNTQKDGAMHALEKARKNAASTFIQLAGKNVPLPSFSSVLTQYSPGEPATMLLLRADQTLSQAKIGGYNRMVVALPAS
ncbi:MAG: diguanylate cyclase [Sulfuricaulis sp.]|uniref:GGDEF domain-containing protein n=1 Tax=Sulfuricaulis sp. TaxID=2003553 RepID=UPI0025FC8A4A|nr:diguanylate cyclase [Sulfuricaulis sp.]MCR4346276.1 diguanylate cyclase [Sulfuricaulis sp.]